MNEHCFAKRAYQFGIESRSIGNPAATTRICSYCYQVTRSRKTASHLQYMNVDTAAMGTKSRTMMVGKTRVRFHQSLSEHKQQRTLRDLKITSRASEHSHHVTHRKCHTHEHEPKKPESAHAINSVESCKCKKALHDKLSKAIVCWKSLTDHVVQNRSVS